MKKVFASLVLALGAFLCTAPASAAIVLKFTPSAQHVDVGGSAIVEVTIEGLGGEILSAFDLNFLYDPTVLNWTLVTYFGANLGNTIGLANNGLPEGNLGFDDSSTDLDATLAASQLDSFLLFRFSFEGIANGVTNFTLGLNPDFERNLVGLDFATLAVDIGSACIAVGTGECSTVPEPSTLSLLGLALGGGALIGIRRRRIA
jgi:PEP-CTERM motif